MPQIASTIQIAAAPQAVYEAAKDIEGLAAYIEALESITVDERVELADGLQTVSTWVGLVPEFNRKLVWTERDVWDDTARECVFSLVKGDLDRYEGRWTFVDDGAGGCRSDLTIDYSLEIPLIGALIKGLLQRKMQDAADSTLAGLRRRAESA